MLGAMTRPLRVRRHTIVGCSLWPALGGIASHWANSASLRAQHLQLTVRVPPLLLEMRWQPRLSADRSSIPQHRSRTKLAQRYPLPALAPAAYFVRLLSR